MKEIQKIAVGESLLYSNAKRIISILKFGNFLIQIRIFGGGLSDKSSMGFRHCLIQ